VASPYDFDYSGFHASRMAPSLSLLAQTLEDIQNRRAQQAVQATQHAHQLELEKLQDKRARDLAQMRATQEDKHHADTVGLQRERLGLDRDRQGLEAAESAARLGYDEPFFGRVFGMLGPTAEAQARGLPRSPMDPFRLEARPAPTAGLPEGHSPSSYDEPSPAAIQARPAEPSPARVPPTGVPLIDASLEGYRNRNAAQVREAFAPVATSPYAHAALEDTAAAVRTGLPKSKAGEYFARRHEFLLSEEGKLERAREAGARAGREKPITPAQESDDIARDVKDYLQATGYRATMGEAEGYRKMLRMAQANNAFTDRALIGMWVKMAQGGSGVLSDSDIEQFWTKAGSPADRTENYIAQALDGRLGDERRQQVRAAIRELAAVGEAHMNARYQGVVEILAGRPRDKARRYLRAYFGRGFPDEKEDQFMGARGAEGGPLVLAAQNSGCVQSQRTALTASHIAPPNAVKTSPLIVRPRIASHASESLTVWIQPLPVEGLGENTCGCAARCCSAISHGLDPSSFHGCNVAMARLQCPSWPPGALRSNAARGFSEDRRWPM
jgi:hypothetical protein